MKTASLSEGVALQPHQQRIAELAADHPLHMLLYHALGSGKSLSGIAAAEAQKQPYLALAPASLRGNYNKELDKFTDHATPAEVMSYSEAGAGKQPTIEPHTLILDEAQRLRNPESAQTKAVTAMADKAKQVIMLSGTPIANSASELTVPLRLLTGEKMTSQEFDARYIKIKEKYPSLFHRLLGWSKGQEFDINHPEELKSKFRNRVDYFAPNKPVVPTQHEEIAVDMGPEQERLYKAIFQKLPWHVRWRMRHDVALTDEELRKTLAFLGGPRQVSLSTHPYQRSPNALRAFDQSPKLQEAMKRLQVTLKDPRAKSLVFANFIDAGLVPYAAALERAKIPHGVFHGGLSDKERKQLVDDYNANKIRVALLGPSGMEGLSFQGTQSLQLLDPHFQNVRGQQAIGRGLRFDSHLDLPKELQNVKVQRFISRLPKSWLDRQLTRLGFDRTHKTLATDDHLAAIAKKKELLNQKFLDLLKEVGSEGKTAGAVWRRTGKLPALVQKLLPETPATAGEAKIRISNLLARKPATTTPAVESASRMAGQPAMPVPAAINELKKSEPSILRRILEGTGLATEKPHPVYRAQTEPMIPSAQAVHVAPRVDIAKDYFTGGGFTAPAAEIPQHAFIGSAPVQPDTGFYPIGGVRFAAGHGNKPLGTRHHIDAYEASMPVKSVLQQFFGERKPHGQAVDVSRVPPEQLRKWYESFAQRVR